MSNPAPEISPLRPDELEKIKLLRSEMIDIVDLEKKLVDMKLRNLLLFTATMVAVAEMLCNRLTDNIPICEVEVVKSKTETDPKLS